VVTSRVNGNHQPAPTGRLYWAWTAALTVAFAAPIYFPLLGGNSGGDESHGGPPSPIALACAVETPTTLTLPHERQSDLGPNSRASSERTASNFPTLAMRALVSGH
jgi:hypothetical protein